MTNNYITGSIGEFSWNNFQKWLVVKIENVTLYQR